MQQLKLILFLFCNLVVGIFIGWLFIFATWQAATILFIVYVITIAIAEDRL